MTRKIQLRWGILLDTTREIKIEPEIKSNRTRNPNIKNIKERLKEGQTGNHLATKNIIETPNFGLSSEQSETKENDIDEKTKILNNEKKTSSKNIMDFRKIENTFQNMSHSMMTFNKIMKMKPKTKKKSQ